MLNRVTCPNCHFFARTVRWNGDCECDNCGNEWNSHDQRKRDLAEKRKRWAERNSNKKKV